MVMFGHFKLFQAILDQKQVLQIDREFIMLTVRFSDQVCRRRQPRQIFKG